MFGGEQLSAAVAREWRRLAPNATLYNCYGIAEATVTSFFHEISEEELLRDSALPVGAPVDGVTFEIVPSPPETCDFPVGRERGELQISGPLVGLGYVRTAKLDRGFLTTGHDARTYATGDLVEASEMGLIHLGRIDDVVKVGGGYRVSPSGLEKSLVEGLHVEQVVVVATFVEEDVKLWGFVTGVPYEITEGELLAKANQILPKNCALSGINILASIPVKDAAKTDRQKLRQRISWCSDGHQRLIGGSDIASNIVGFWTNVLGDRFNGDPMSDFFAIGGSSYEFAQLVSLIEDYTKTTLDAREMLANCTPVGQAQIVGDQMRQSDRGTDRLATRARGAAIQAELEDTRRNRGQPDRGHIVVTAVATKLPGIDNWQTFCQFLEGGVPLDAPISPTRLGRLITSQSDESGSPSGNFFTSDEILSWRNGSSLDDVSSFALEPQQVLWSRLVDDICSRVDIERQRVGSYVGLGPTFFTGQREDGSVGRHSLAATTPSFGVGLVAYKHDFSGPQVVVNTACSSSLVADDLACQALAQNTIDAALVGGVQVFHSKHSFRLLGSAQILSKRGTCRPFDMNADGYITCEAGVALLLTSEEMAHRYTLPILAHVLGVATNHDGKSASPTAPNPDRQETLMQECMMRAGLDANDVDFVEAHGSGTPLGDPVELAAIRSVFGNRGQNELFVGSAKGYFGHAHYAAGGIGLLKAIAQINKAKVFRQPAIEKVNPRLVLDNTGISIPLEHCDLASDPIGIVQSFGFSGTNCCLAIAGEAKRQHQQDSDSEMSLRASIPDSIVSRSAAEDLLQKTLDAFTAAVAAKLDIKEDAVSLELTPVELGVDSIDCMEIVEQVNIGLGTRIPPTALLHSASVRSIVEKWVDKKQIGSDGEGGASAARRSPAEVGSKTAAVQEALRRSARILPEASLANELSKQFRLETEVLSGFLQKGPSGHAMIREIRALWSEQRQIMVMALSCDSSSLPLDQDEYATEGVSWGEEAQPDDIEASILKAVADASGLPRAMVGRNDRFIEDLGMNSLSRMKMATELCVLVKGDSSMLDALLACSHTAAVLEVMKHG